jgi:tRNA(fMet)-specific endonuclease VapC
MKGALLDTDTISFFLRRDSNVVMNLTDYLTENEAAHISVVTYYEILNGLYFKDAKKQLAAFERFATLNTIVPLTSLIAKKSARIYAELRAAGRVIGHNDVLIAGTALVNDLTLVTNNTRHFAQVAGLDWANWTIA